MPLTRDFKETIKARAARDDAFREALLSEAVELLLSGEIELGKSVMRDYINATVGFEKLASETNTGPKTLMRMFSKKGNPTTSKLFAVISHLQKATGVQLTVKAA